MHQTLIKAISKTFSAFDQDISSEDDDFVDEQLPMARRRSTIMFSQPYEKRQTNLKANLQTNLQANRKRSIL